MNESNPDWVSAPYEESGLVNMEGLAQAIEHLSMEFKRIELVIELDDDSGLFKYRARDISE